MTARVESHVVRRAALTTALGYDELRKRYHESVPHVDRDRIADFVRRGAPWSEVVADADARAPHGFFIFWQMEVTETMRLAGNAARCTEYLMGNHTIAERMFRHDPTAMLYVPLRTLIYASGGDEAGSTFVVDQPSSLLSSLDDPNVSAVAEELDEKLARLFEALELPVPAWSTTRP
jgi:uncharacterized protein (DUF302 family)